MIYTRLALGMLHEDRIVLALLLAKIYLKTFLVYNINLTSKHGNVGDFLISKFISDITEGNREVLDQQKRLNI